MKRGQNPLYPESEGKGLMGVYEEAALMDDSAESFRENKLGIFRGDEMGSFEGNFRETRRKRRAVDGRGNDWEADLEFMEDVRRGKKEFDARDREIVEGYRRKLAELRQRKRAREISRKEFRRLKRGLMRETERERWGNLGKFWFGG